MKAAVLLAVLALAACSSSGSSPATLPAGSTNAPRDTQDIFGGAPRARFEVVLFDAPLANAPGAKVNVGLDAVQLLSGNVATGFVTNTKPQIVNLLDLQDDALSFKGSAPIGAYTGIRILIDAASSNVVLFGRTYPIVWGSPGHAATAAVVAVDVACPFVVMGPGNSAYGKVTVDFNVMQSVRFVNGTIYVQPSLTASNAAAQIHGSVANAAGKPVSSATVVALNPLGRIVNSTATKADGSYTIHALPPGIYTVAVRNRFVTAAGETILATNADPGAAPSTTVVLSPEDDFELSTLID